MPVIRVFNRTGQEHQRTSDAVRKNAELQSSWGRAFVAWGSPFSTLVASSIAIIAPVAAWLLARDVVDLPTALLFLILGPTYPVPLVTLFYRLVALPVLSSGAVDIERQLANRPEDTTERTIPAPSVAPGEVRVEHLSFSYSPGILALDDVTFTAFKAIFYFNHKKY